MVAKISDSWVKNISFINQTMLKPNKIWNNIHFYLPEVEESSWITLTGLARAGGTGFFFGILCFVFTRFIHLVNNTDIIMLSFYTYLWQFVKATSLFRNDKKKKKVNKMYKILWHAPFSWDSWYICSSTRRIWDRGHLVQ